MLTLLSRLGVVSREMLSQYRKHAVLIALILSAIVTPDATLFTMLLMAVPLMVLYEVGILGVRLFGVRKSESGSAGTGSGGPVQGGLPVGTAGQRVL